MPYRQNRWTHPAVVAACVGVSWALLANAASAQGGPVPVVVAPVVEREVAAGQTFVGTVMPLRKAIIGSAVDGRVIEFPKNAGDRVEQGEPLAKLLTTTIKLELKAAEAELTLRQQQLAELKNGVRPEELKQAEARMVSAEATMRHLQSRRTRIEAMYANNRAVSEDERDAAVSEAIAAEQDFEDARQAYALARQGARVEQVAQAQAQVEMQQAIVERLRDQIEKHTIVSRFAGYVTAEHTEVGQWLKSGDAVAEVVALDEVEITVQLVEQYVPYTRVGMAVDVEIPAIPGRHFAGVVTAIVPQADVQARTFPVQVRVQNELVDERQPLLKAGMYARVTLPTSRKELAVLVSKDALVMGGLQPTVYAISSAVQGQPAKARLVPVDLGAASGNLMQVRGQIAAGEFVVVQGNERLRPPFDVIVQRIVSVDTPAEATSAQFQQR